jgi:hypothetical protein
MARYTGATMSDDKSFLARWSRRKRDAAPDTREQTKPENADGGVASEASAASFSPVETKLPFDVASLPPIESIGAASDICAFLAAGVPAELTRAALRRAWSSDPRIRDFVGLSENSWDFNARDGVPGFGAIDKEEVGRLLTRLRGEPDATAVGARPSTTVSQADKDEQRASESDPAEEIQTAPESAKLVPAQDQRPQGQDTTNASNNVTQRSKAAAASQYETAPREHRPPTPRRGHGGALPQ